MSHSPKVLLVGDAKYIHIRRWASGLARKKIDLTLLSPTSYKLKEIKFVRDGVPPLRPWRFKRWGRRRSEYLRKVLEGTNPDIIDVHFLGPYSIFPHDIGARRLVVSVWGKDIVPDGPEDADQQRLKVRILQRADRVVALSRMLGESTRNYAQLPPEKIDIGYWGVDLQQFRRSLPLTHEPVVGFFKHLLPKYGPEILLRAFALVAGKMNGATLFMVGTGDMERELKDEAVRLGVGDQTHWFGHVPHERIKKLYERCAVTVMPSTVDSETLGVSALESQAMEVPVIGSRIGGIPESICDETTGILVPTGDVEALAAAILRLLSDHDLRGRFGRAGRERIKNNFDWESTLQHKISTYRELVDANKSK